MTKDVVNIRIPVWSIQPLGHSKAAIFGMIYYVTHSKRKCFDGSINYISERIGQSKRTVLRHLKELEEMGAIKRIGFNSYRNVKYVSIVDKNSISKCQNVDRQSDNKQSDNKQRCKMPFSDFNDVTLQSDIMSPHKSIIINNNTSLIKDNKKDIYIKHIYLKKDMSSTLDERVIMEDEKMIYKTHQEYTYNKTTHGWWKQYTFFADDEELNDLFIKLLDKTAHEQNNYIDGCSSSYDIVSISRTKMKYSDSEIDNMSEDEFKAIPQEDLQPIDKTTELKSVLRDFVYNANKEALHIYLGLIA